MHRIKTPVAPIAAALLLAFGAAQAATIQITSRDPAGVGFDDPTPVAPVGGNNGSLGRRASKTTTE